MLVQDHGFIVRTRRESYIMSKLGTYRFGKSMYDVMSLRSKNQMFTDNGKYVVQAEKAYKLYQQQPKRAGCKICSEPLLGEKYFHNRGTDFYLCEICGHLNGEFDDGWSYTKLLYESELSEYGDDYNEDTAVEYIKRLDAIYVPKAQFLLNSIAAGSLSGGGHPEPLKFIDFGAGAGYFVSALDRLGLDALGIELSKTQVEYANRASGKNLLRLAHAEDIADIVRTTERNVISFINVLEHITNVSEVFECIQLNKNIKYLYFSVPLVSLACVFELIFPDVHARHLGGGGGHTHLYTRESIEWIFERYGFSRIATWDFGSDIMDLYRSVMLTLETQNCHPDMIEELQRFFQMHGDALQLVIDISGFQSDTHVVARVH